MVREQTDTVFIFALSANYFQLIEQDLLQLEGHELGRVRIAGLRPREKTPDRLSPFCMPYDDRLDGPDSTIPGTRGDFPQRSIKHFVEQIYIQFPSGTVEEHRAKVGSLLKCLRHPEIISRTPKSDEELVSIIRANIGRVDGKSTKMLRYLRDILQIACEQKRFQGLFKRAVDER